MRYFLPVLILPFFGSTGKVEDKLCPRSFYAEMKALEPERVTAYGAVQTANNTNSSTSINVTLSSTTQYNLVVVTVEIVAPTSPSITISSITDNASNTYTIGSYVDKSSGATNLRIYQGYGIQSTGGNTQVTVSLTGGTPAWLAVACDEYSGFNSSTTNANVFDAQTTGTGTGTSMSVSTLTPSETGELIVASGGNSGATYTAGSGYTNYGTAFFGFTRSQYKLSGAATETAPWTTSSSVDWAEIATAYKAATAATNTGGFFKLFKP